MTPLHRACERANYDTAKVLLKRGADVNAKSANDETPLILACRMRMRGVTKARIVKLIELLIDNHADIGAVTKNGRTARKALKDNRLFSRAEIQALLGPSTSISRMDTLDAAAETSSASSLTPSYRLSLNNVCDDDFIVLDDHVHNFPPP
jgi:ankyrin repeat protein